MRPRHYLDIMARGKPKPAAAAQVLRILHAAFISQPACYALALPEHAGSQFACLRIFAETPEDLHQLHLYIEDEATLAAFGVVRAIKNVPTSFDGSWISYRRYRIPTRKAERIPGGQLRIRRMLEADAMGLPFFAMRSQSTGQNFRLYIESIAAEPQTEPCQPDGYGLASATRAFALPACPCNAS